MEDKLHTDLNRSLARYLYAVEFKEPDQIAKETDIPANAIRDWIGQGSWGNLRNGLLTSKRHQMTILYDMLAKLSEKIRAAADPNIKDVELMTKYTASIRNLDTTTDLGTITEVGRKFCLWLRQRDKELSHKVCAAFGDFLADEAKVA